MKTLLLLMIHINIFAFQPAYLVSTLKQFKKLNSSPINCHQDISFQQGHHLSNAHLYHKKVNLDYHTTFQQARHYGHNISILTKAQAEKLFQDLSNIDYMKFEHLEDGCFNRAHEFALIAKNNGITMGKAFIEHSGISEAYNNPQGAGAPDIADSKLLLYPQQVKSLTRKPFIDSFMGWEYHVAPYVLVKQGSQVIPYMFDIGVSTKAQSLSDWKKSLHSETRKLAVRFTPAHYMDEQGITRRDDSTIKEELEREQHIKEVGADQYFGSRI